MDDLADPTAAREPRRKPASLGAVPVRTPSADAIAAHKAGIERILAEEAAFGQVKPVISAKAQGGLWVAVGNELHWCPESRTFPDFLFQYIKVVLGADWWRAEVEKPATERHLILQLNGHVCELQKRQVPGPDGLYGMIPDGITAAYLLLAYDLYVLRNHGKLLETVVHRLKHCEYSAARYELFAAATFIRAGLRVDHEDESDGDALHPEFVATDSVRGDCFDIEVKACEREGVLGFPGTRRESGKLKLKLHRKLNDAAAKVRDRPLIAFVDLNLPRERVGESLEAEVQAAITAFEDKLADACPLSLLVVTNYTDHYADFGETAFVRFNHIQEPRGPLMNRQVSRDVIKAIELALCQYGSVPNVVTD